MVPIKWNTTKINKINKIIKNKWNTTGINKIIKNKWNTTRINKVIKNKWNTTRINKVKNKWNTTRINKIIKNNNKIERKRGEKKKKKKLGGEMSCVKRPARKINKMHNPTATLRTGHP